MTRNVKIIASRNQREGKFMGFRCSGWRQHPRTDAVERFHYLYRGEQGRLFREGDLEAKSLGADTSRAVIFAKDKP